MALSWQPIFSVDDITQQQWGQLSNHNAQFSSPFLSYQYLKGLESSACVNGKTGWHSYHIGIFSDHNEESNEEYNELIAFIPCYLKTHSYGEYIFDHAWANAYQHHQIPYYPKLVACIPFTPVTGSRILIKTDCEHSFEEINRFIVENTDLILSEARASSLHILFLPEYQSRLLIADPQIVDSPIENKPISDKPTEIKLLQKLSVQFVWQNRDYASFDDFMQQMTSRKRRSIRKERANAVKGVIAASLPVGSDAMPIEVLANEAFANEALANEAVTNNPVAKNIDVKRLVGEQITPEVMADFYLCYQQTYLKRSGHKGYLTEAFFEFLRTEMQTNIMVVIAYAEGKCIAAALFFYNEEQLFGRYWGALHEVSGLHFECCYYQGIEFAIEKNLRQFNPGTQGEHKILRGFEPTFCYSNHYLQHPDFQKAVADFLHNERIGIEQYKKQGDSVLPFKKQDGK